MKIAFLGPTGTFSEEAALQYGDGGDHQFLPYSCIRDVILAVHRGEADEGVVPIENSLEGSVNVTTDMLVHDVNLYIRKEIILPVYQCIMATKCHPFHEFEIIFSHPQALAQCRGYITKNLPQAEEKITLSTAEAARTVAQMPSEPWAAIGSVRAANIFQLEVLEENIQDHKGNSTRFVALSKSYERYQGSAKSSVAFTVSHKPGSLLEALKVFADAGINLTRIESRPMRTMLGQYLFLVDMEGHCEEDKVARHLKILAEKSLFYKFLGSYSAGSS